MKTRKTQTTKNPIAVIINDVHYNLKNLKVANDAMELAIDKANDLMVRLVVAGDLHDTKANLRGECVQTMIKTFKQCLNKPIVIVGNHCLINEKSKDHSLEFLRPYAHIIDYPKFMSLPEVEVVVHCIPYQANKEDFKLALEANTNNRIVICHQGLENSESGEYFKDHSAIPQEWTKNHIFISGHYHKRQTIGNWTYTGNPYTIGFGEANDPEKGFHILYNDGSLEFVPTNLRKHVKLQLNCKDNYAITTLELPKIQPDDLLWVKLSGPKDKLSKLTKKEVSTRLGIEIPFKLDFIPDKVQTAPVDNRSISHADVLDKLIESATVEADTKKRLKNLWKSYAN